MINKDENNETIKNLKIYSEMQKLGTKKLTGKPSIDKPWQQHFSQQAIDFKLDNETIYNYMLKNAKKMQNACAIRYFDTKISYNTLLAKIESTAKAFKNMGIEKGDIVTALLPSSPEAVYTIYALNRLGAIINPIDPRIKEDKLIKCLKEINPKLIVTLDLCSELISNASKNLNIDKIVSVSAIESLPYGIRKMNGFVEGLKGHKVNSTPDNRFITWQNFINQGKNCIDKIDYEYDFDRTAAIIYTGGTTGTKKGVKLSNNNINAMVKQHELSGIPFHAGQKFLDFLPPFIAYGLVMAIHMPLSFGFETNMIPVFEPKDFPKLILKSKPAYVFASPVHYEALMNYKRKKDLSFLIVPVSGGDSMTAEFEERVNEEFARSNCKSKLGQGLGMTEAGGTMSVPIPKKIKAGSVGVPFANTLVSVFDVTTGKELSYYEKGELCFFGPSLMSEYLNNPEETSNVLRKHEDGKIWLHTGDIGYMDEEGYVYHVDRIKRIINRGGLKVYPSEVEKTILLHPNVHQCVVVSVDNEEERHVPIAHIILNDYSNILQTELEILDVCERKLDPESIPFGIRVRNDIPYTLNGKVDYKKLESDAYCEVDLSQDIQNHSNMSFAKRLVKHI